VNNKGKAIKRMKPTNEIGESFCVLADSEGNDDEEEELGETAFQNLKDNKKEEEEEVPKYAFLTIRTCYLEWIIMTKSHLIIKTSQLSLFLTTSIVMGLGFFCTRTLTRFSLTYS
jgi:hypothetical protein